MRKLLTVPETAKELGLSRQRVHQLADAGLLKSVKILGRRGVKPEDLEAFKVKVRPQGRPKQRELYR